MKFETDESVLDWLENEGGVKRIAARYRLDFHDFMAEAYLAVIRRGWRKHILNGDIAYINRSLKNLAFDIHRSARYRRREVQASFEDNDSCCNSSDQTLDEAIRNETQTVCRHAIEQLPNWLRIAVQMVYLEGQSVKECADQLATTPASIRSRLRKACLELRAATILSDYHSDNSN